MKKMHSILHAFGVITENHVKMKRRRVPEIRTKSSKPQKKNGSTEHGVIRTHPQHLCTCGLERIFPWWFPGVVFIVTVLVRMYYVYQPANWWVLHPDEVFQSVEGNNFFILHRLVARNHGFVSCKQKWHILALTRTQSCQCLWCLDNYNS